MAFPGGQRDAGTGSEPDHGTDDAAKQADFPRPLSNVLGDLAKLAGALAVFGYVELRAHVNALGLSAATSLGLERYLAELWMLVAHSLAPLITALFALTVIAGPVVYLRARRVPTSESVEKVDAVYSHPWLGAPLFLAVIALLAARTAPVIVQRMVDLFPPIVGQLGSRPDGWPAELLLLTFAYYALFLLVVVGYGVHAGWAKRAVQQPTLRATRVARTCWVLFGMGVLALAVQLPIMYGVGVRPATYPLASVTLVPNEGGPAATECGVLVLESNEFVQLWQIVGNIGTTIVIPRDHIGSVVIGEPVNVRDVADSASRGRPTGVCGPERMVSDVSVK